MKLGKRKWVKGGRPERSGFDENLLKFGGPGGGAARRTSKKAKTNVSKTGKADSTASGVEEMGGRSAKLQSRKSGANLAGNARRKIPRGDLTPPSGWGPGMGSPVPRQKLLQRQAKKDAKAKEAQAAATTKAATAQTGLNAAMKANPLIAIISAII